MDRSSLRFILGGALVMAVGAAFVTRDRWPGVEQPAADGHTAVTAASEPDAVKLSPQARQNLGLVCAPLTVQTFWRTIQIPGAVVDRPGLSDRGVSSPAVAVVAKVHAFPGDTVQPGARLFTLRLISEYI